MRAREFIFEYNQAKTAQNFGSKLLLALSNDRSSVYPGSLGTARNELRMKKFENPSHPDVDPFYSITPQTKAVIIADILKVLENIDPTKNKEYVQWLAKIYATPLDNVNMRIEDLMSRGKNWLTTFHKMKMKNVLPVEVRDINKFNLGQLGNIATNQEYLDQLDEVEALANPGKFRIALDTPEVVIVIPEDMAGSRTAARLEWDGSKLVRSKERAPDWCTATMSGNNMFDHYAGAGKMYILIPKQPMHEEEKYQVHIDSGQFMDERDDYVNEVDLLSKRFGNLVPWFKEQEPDLSQYVAFADDDFLQPILDKIAEKARENYIHEWVFEYESSDDSYYQWVADQGYVDENGDTDWERFSSDGYSYFDYNEDAKDAYDKMNNEIEMTASYLKKMCPDFASDQEKTPIITTMDELVAYVVAQSAGREDDYIEGLARWIKHEIIVREDGSVQTSTENKLERDRIARANNQQVELD